MELSLTAEEVLEAHDIGFSTPKVKLAAAFKAAADLGKLRPEHWEGSSPDDREQGWNDSVVLAKIGKEVRLNHCCSFFLSTYTPAPGKYMV